MFKSLVSKRCIHHFFSLRQENYLKEALKKNIEVAKLSFDRFSYNTDTAKQFEKSPVIILHGLFGSKANNRTVAKQLSELLARDVYCLDLRNHGSSQHLARHDYPLLANDVEHWLFENGIKKPILIGHSMGAKTVMAMALRDPKLPELVIAVDNAPISYNYSSGSKFSKYIKLLIEITERKQGDVVKNKSDADKVLARFEPNLTVRRFLLTNVERKTKEEIQDEYDASPVLYSNNIENVPVFKSKIPLRIIGKALDNGNVAIFPYDSHYSQYKGEILFVRGTESPYVPDDILPEIGKFFPKFEVKDVKAGHWLISENPKSFLEIVVDWIEFKEEVLCDQENGIQDITL